jgi:hypothetical protein
MAKISKTEKLLALYKEAEELRSNPDRMNPDYKIRSKHMEKEHAVQEKIDRALRPGKSIYNKVHKLGYLPQPNSKELHFPTWLWNKDKELHKLTVTRISELTPEQVKLLPKLETAKKEWEAVKMKAQEKQDKEAERLLAEFRKDLEAEFGTTNSPHRDTMWTVAKNSEVFGSSRITDIYDRYKRMMRFVVPFGIV